MHAWTNTHPIACRPPPEAPAWRPDNASAPGSTYRSMHACPGPFRAAPCTLHTASQPPAGSDPWFTWAPCTRACAPRSSVRADRRGCSSARACSAHSGAAWSPAAARPSPPSSHTSLLQGRRRVPGPSHTGRTPCCRRHGACCRQRQRRPRQLLHADAVPQAAPARCLAAPLRRWHVRSACTCMCCMRVRARARGWGAEARHHHADQPTSNEL